MYKYKYYKYKNKYLNLKLYGGVNIDDLKQNILNIEESIKQELKKENDDKSL